MIKGGAKTGIALVCLMVLGGCGVWLGEKEAPPLPGKRISILSHEQALTADPTLATANILLPAPSSTPDWPQAGGYPNHAMHHLKTGQALNQVWSADIGDGIDDERRLLSSPVVANSRVFTIDTDSMVSAFDARTGKRLWRQELTPDAEDDGHASGGLAYSDGLVFAATGFADVVAMDSASGAIVWRKSVSGPMRAPPTVWGGRIFVVSLDNTLHALSAKDGTFQWKHNGTTESAAILGSAAPTVDGGVVITAYSSGELVALKAETGRVLWIETLSKVRRRSADISTLSHIRGRPVIDRGRVIAMSGSMIVSIDMKTGRRLWTKNIGGFENPWVAGKYIFVLTKNSEIISLSRKDGRVFWVRSLPQFEDPEDREDPIVWTGPVLGSDRLIVSGSHGTALAISPYNGEIISTQNLPDGVSVAPVIADQMVYFITDDAELVAFR